MTLILLDSQNRTLSLHLRMIYAAVNLHLYLRREVSLCLRKDLRVIEIIQPVTYSTFLVYTMIMDIMMQRNFLFTGFVSFVMLDVGFLRVYTELVSVLLIINNSSIINYTSVLVLVLLAFLTI